KAIDNFDLSQGVKFSTYAVPMIIGEIRRYLRDNNSIRVSRSLRDTAYKAIYAREAFIKQNNREPSVMEVAGEIGISKEDVVFAMDAIQSPMSLYEPVYSEGGDKLCIMDQVKDTKNTEASWVENIALRDAIERLGDRERKIIDMRFFEGKTQMEVAAELAISQAQISRIEKNALKSMRTYLQQ
ncbi:MAG: sigma-70 family RNA polymerase sigma factor, partial [Frisingicoccus sp.]